MNLFRGRRGSTASANSETGNGDNNLFNATATLRRVFLPRSRSSTPNSSNTMVTPTDDWTTASKLQEKQPLQQPHRRTASLSRNLSRRNRSVTMPNIPNSESRGQSNGSEHGGAFSNNTNTNMPAKVQPLFSTFRATSQPRKNMMDEKTSSNSTVRRRSRPASADVSMLMQTGSERRKQGATPPPPPRRTTGSSSAAASSMLPRDRSVDSLLTSETGNTRVLSTSVTETSGLSSLVDRDIQMEDDDEATPIAGTPDVNQKRKATPNTNNNKSLDSLLDDEQQTPQPRKLTSTSRAKSNSLPKSAFGTLQLKVAEIRAQLDVLKSNEPSTISFQKAFKGGGGGGANSFKGGGGAKTPTRPHEGGGAIMHPNTPAQGFEHMTPPNLKTSASTTSFYPLFPSGNHNLNHLISHAPNASERGGASVGGRDFHSPAGSSNSQCDTTTTDSVSPLSSSPHRTCSSPYGKKLAKPVKLSLAVTCTPNLNNMQVNSSAQQPNANSVSSSSPSTLSPASSNSLPSSANRPAMLRLSQSLSMTNFNSSAGQQFPPMMTSSMTSADLGDEAAQLERLFLFFDVLSTQEKIAKVQDRYSLVCQI